MIIHAGYFAKLKVYKDHRLFPVSIACGDPKWLTEPIPNVRHLNPDRHTLRWDAEPYTEAYLKKLASLDPKQVVKELERQGDGRDVVLLWGSVEEFGPQRQLALQLSHNAIHGQDDLSALQGLYSELEDLALKAYTGIDETALFNYHALDFPAISEQDIALAELNFTFCDSNKLFVEGVLDKLEAKGLDPEKDALVVGDVDKFIQVMTRIKNKLGVKNRSVAFLAMCRICEESLAAEAV